MIYCVSQKGETSKENNNVLEHVSSKDWVGWISSLNGHIHMNYEIGKNLYQGI